MISQAFGMLRVRTTATEQQDSTSPRSGISSRPSFSFDTPAPSPMDGVITDVSPKVTMREQKRYSNSLFGSGKPRDVSDRKVQGGDWRSAPSDTGSDVNIFSRTLRTKFNFLRSGSPEVYSPGIFTPPNPDMLTDRESLSIPESTILDSSPDTSTEMQRFRLDTPKRASPVMGEVNRGAKGGTVDDDIILLHSPTDYEDNLELGREDVEKAFTVTALSHDDNVTVLPAKRPSRLMYRASKSMSPTHRIPGYIPGMQRPMTPHDIPEPGEPATTSKLLPSGGCYDEMNTSTHLMHGEDGSGDSAATSTWNDIDKTIARNVGVGDLPRTPCIEIRFASAQEYYPGNDEMEDDYEITPSVISEKDHGPLLPFPRMSRSHSPGGGTSPMITATGTANHRGGAGKGARSHSFSLDRPNFMGTSATTGVGKHQKHEPSSPFVLSVEYSTRSLTPLPNSSRSSFGSDGSSYYSIGWEDGKEDHVRILFAKIEGEPPEWHNFTDTGIDPICVSDHPEEASSTSMEKQEELVRQLSGLGKSDFAAIQRKLLDAARQRGDREGGSNASIRPGLGAFTGQFGSSNSPIPGDDGLAQRASTRVQSRAAVRKMLFDFPIPPAVKRKADRVRTPSPTLGFGQRSRKFSGTINTEPSQIGETSSRGSYRGSPSPALTNNSRLVRDERDKTRPSFLALLFTILDYPPFNEIIHWDDTTRVVLERPRILESHILMPVFGLSTLDDFKRRLYACGFDVVPDPASGIAWEHSRLTKLNPPMGFTSWSEAIKSGEPETRLFGPDEVVAEEEFCPRDYTPIPVSVDGGKTLDWSRPVDGEASSRTPAPSGPIIRHEKKLAAIRLRLRPEVRESASKVAEDLQRRYDLLFLHLETPKPLRLTSILRWGVSNSKIPAHAWKSPVLTQVIEDYLPDEPDDYPTSPIHEKDWAHAVTDFISKCDHLYKITEPEPWPLGNDDRPRARSRASSRTSSLSEGHVSPDDDGPSRKVVHHDD